MTFSKKDKKHGHDLITKYINFIKEGRGMSEDKKNDFLDEITNYIENKNFAPRTKMSKYSNFKNYFKSFKTVPFITDNKEHINFTYPRLFNRITAPTNLKNSVDEMNFESMKKRKIIKISEKKFLEKIIILKESKNPIDQFYYLSFVTGRRPIEILTSTFILPNNKNSNKLKVTGLAKKRTKRNTTYFIKIIQYPFEKKELILKRINNIQSSFGSIKTASVVKKLNYHFLKRFAILGINKIHLLRSLYAEYLFKYHNPEFIIKTAFIAKVLNHSSMSSAPHYTEIELI